MLSVLSAGSAPFQRRVLPWSAGLLLGVGIFWVLPELAVEQGWALTLAGVACILLLLGWVDRYVYPICPFCAAGIHAHETAGPAVHGRAIGIGWPLLAFGCVHVFFDGWTIALSQVMSQSAAASAVSWGITIHKIPESVALGVLAVRMTSSRGMALAAVALMQVVMAAGGVSAMLAGRLDSHWAEISALPACAFLLLFGFLALQQEWRLRGRAPAMRAAAPGFLGCGLAALLSTLLTR